jgi:hypothetical protein
MIEIKIKLPILNYKLIYFSDHPLKNDSMKFVQYDQCKSLTPCPGFKREKCFTKIINLSQDIEMIFNNLKKIQNMKITRQ